MKLVTCIGATSGRNLITISPLFVTMWARYDFAGSNFAIVGALSLVFHAASDLFTASFAIWASMDFTTASTAGAAAFAAGLAAALAVVSAASAGLSWA